MVSDVWKGVERVIVDLVGHNLELRGFTTKNLENQGPQTQAAMKRYDKCSHHGLGVLRVEQTSCLGSGNKWPVWKDTSSLG
jgi:hypothetical protein